VFGGRSKIDRAKRLKERKGENARLGRTVGSQPQAPAEDAPVNQYTKTPSRSYGYDANGNMTDIAAFCPGDTDGDALVGVDDLSAVQSNFGETCTSLGITAAESLAYGDLNGDCSIDLTDQLEVLGAFGATCFRAELR
jgi:hypothetical protein